MGGGILQLSAKSSEDIYITTNPTTTFFKTVYRRHTHFSTEITDLSFNRRLTFGTESKCKLRRYGDLVHRLFLEIQLPEIEFVYKEITINEVFKMVFDCDIRWNYFEEGYNGNDIFNQTSFSSLEPLILDRIGFLEDVLEKIEIIMTNLETIYVPGTWIFANVKTEDDYREYFDTIVLDEFFTILFPTDPRIIIYKYLVGYGETFAKLNDIQNTDIINSLIQRNLWCDGTVPDTNGDCLSDFIFSANNPTSASYGYFDENIEFLYNVELGASYSLNTGFEASSSSNIFRNGINNEYISSSEYSELDSYKIFDSVLTDTNILITGQSDIVTMKNIIVNHIYDGIRNNFQLIYNIFGLLTNEMRLIFYKYDKINDNVLIDWTQLGGTNPTDINLRSRMEQDDYIIPTISTDITNYYQNYIDNNISLFHIVTKSFFNEPIYQQYFNVVDLWSKLDSQIRRTELGHATSINHSNMFNIDYVPLIMRIDIREGLENALDQAETEMRYGLNYGFKANLLLHLDTISTTIFNNLQNIFDVTEISDGNIIDSLHGELRDGDTNKKVVMSSFRGGRYVTYSGSDYLLPQYVAQEYLDSLEYSSFTNGDYNSGTSDDLQLDLKDVINRFITEISDLPIQYSTYKITNNFNIKKPSYFVGGDALPVNIISTSESDPPLSDIVSSIYFNINNNLVTEFNELFDGLILNRSYLSSNIGIQAREIIDSIFTSNSNGGIDDTDGYDFTNNQLAGYTYDSDPELAIIDFYRYATNDNYSIPQSNIQNFITTNYLDTMDLHIKYYDENKNLLKLCTITPESDSLFDRYEYNYNFYENELNLLSLESPLHDAAMKSSIEDIYNPNSAPDPNIVNWEYQNAMDIAISLFGNEPDGKTGVWDETTGFLNFVWSMYGPNPMPNPYMGSFPGSKIEEVWNEIYNDYFVDKNFGTEYDGLNSVYSEIYKYSTMISPLLDSKTVEIGYDYFPYISTPTDPFPNNNNWVFEVKNELTPQTFSQKINIINNFFNNLEKKRDVIDFLKDIVLSTSSFPPTPNISIPISSGSPVPPSEGDILTKDILDLSNLAIKSITKTYENVVNYVNSYKNKITEELNKLNDLLNTLKILIKGGQNGYFSWIRKLGHYLIDYIYVKIGDQVIDTHYGEWFEIWHELTKHNVKEDKYKYMIGDIPKLTNYSKRRKREHTINLPLLFWFCSDPSLSLPLVSLQHTTVDIVVKLKTFDKVAKWDNEATFKTKPQLECKILAEYIHVDVDERKRLTTKKHQYLIEQLQYNSDAFITLKDISEDPSNNLFVQHKIYFKHPTKELFWIFQNMEQAMNMEYHNFGINYESAKIEFNERTREQYKSFKIFNYKYPHDHHTHTPYEGINVYPFCTEPENIRPTGTANLSKFNSTKIVLILNEDTIQKLENGDMFRWGVYGKSYNILRIMSGMGGLAYIK